MKKLIGLVIILIFLMGCAMTAEQAKQAKDNFNRHPHKILVP